MTRKFAVVIGHSAESPGAMGVSPISTSEYFYNRDLSQIIYRHAMALGLPSRIFTRDGMTIEQCYENVNQWCEGTELACAVELHLNAFDGKVRGTETLWDQEPTTNVEYARELQGDICSVFGRRGKDNRGLKLLNDKLDRGHRNMNACKVISALLEPLFCDNPQDALLGVTKKNDYAKAIVNATIRFMHMYEKQKQNEMNPGLH